MPLLDDVIRYLKSSDSINSGDVLGNEESMNEAGIVVIAERDIDTGLDEMFVRFATNDMVYTLEDVTSAFDESASSTLGLVEKTAFQHVIDDAKGIAQVLRDGRESDRVSDMSYDEALAAIQVDGQNRMVEHEGDVHRLSLNKDNEIESVALTENYANL